MTRMIPRPRSSPGDRAASLDRFGLLLLLVVATVVVLSLVDLDAQGSGVQGMLGGVAVSASLVVTLLLALRAAGVDRRVQRVVGAAVSLGLAALVGLVLIDAAVADVSVPSVSARPSFVVVVLSACAPIVVVRRLLQHRRVSLSTLYGAVAAYLLVAIAFSLLFETLDAYQATPFFGRREPTTSFMSFSLVTMTTLGYGNLVPASDLGRLLANAEALVGQVYLVTFVGMVVGLYAAARHESTAPRDPTDGAVGSARRPPAAAPPT